VRCLLRVRVSLTALSVVAAALAAARPAPTAEAPPPPPATPAPPDAGSTAAGIRDWLLLGSFPRDDAATRLTAPILADEAAAAPRPGDPAEGLLWKLHRAPDRVIDLAARGTGFAYVSNAVAYAFTYVLCPDTRPARLRLRSTGGIAAWVNGELAGLREHPSPVAPDENEIPIQLLAGWNLLLLKLAQETGPWTFSARIADVAGRPMPDVQCVPEPSAARPPLPDLPSHGLQSLGCDVLSPEAAPDGTVRIGLLIRLRNLAPAAAANATISLNTDPKTPLAGVPWPETAPLPPWGGRTARIDLSLKDLLALSQGASPGVEITSGGTSRYSRFDPDFPIRALLGVLRPIRITRWGVLNQDDKGAAEASFPNDAALPRLAPDAEVTPAAPTLWLRARLAMPEPLAGAPVALASGRAGLRTEVFVNGASLGEAQGLESPLPLHAAPQHVIALKVDPAGTRPLRLPATDILPADEASRFCERNLEACLTLFPDLRDAIRTDCAAALKALAGGGAGPFANALGRINETLRQRARGLKDFTLWYVGRSHVDLAWLWRRDEAVRLARDAFGQALQLAGEFPRFTYAQDQAALYAAVEQQAPDLFAKVRQAVQARRWSVVGGMWVEPDLNLPSGESLVRQLLHGQRYFQRAFGAMATVAWLPDTTGSGPQLPQLLKKAGIEACHVLRGTEGRPLFWWEGLDGTRLLAHAVPPRPPSADFVRELREAERLAPIHLQPFGADAPGGGPTRDDLRRIDALRAREIFPTADCGTPEEFFARTAGTAKALPKVTGPLRDPAAGTWTTRGDMKQANRRGEGLLADAETASALARETGLPCDRDSLSRAWRLLLLNQAHPILGGTAIREVYADAAEDHAALAHEAGRVLQSALDALAARLPTAGEGIPLVVFNPLPWPRTDVAEADVLFDGPLRTLAVLDDAGDEVPCQVVPRPAGPVRLLFLARDVPATGFRVFRVRDAGTKKKAFPPVQVAANGTRIETDRWRLAIDPVSGEFTLHDARHGREAVSSGPSDGSSRASGGNRLQLFGDRGADSARTITYTGERWELDRGASIRALESGPVRAVVRITRTFKDERPDFSFGGLTTVHQDVVVYRELDRIELRHEIDWNERYKILKIAFPLGVKAAPVAAEVPYGVLEAPADGTDRPAGTWVDLSEPTYGVAVLNDGRAGFDATGSLLRIHVLRSPFDVDPASDRGIHRFTLALLPHAGDWRHAALPRRGRELNRPLRAWTARAHAGAFPAGQPLVSVEPANVVADAVKRAEDSEALIVRLAEMHGAQGTVARVRLWRDAAKAAETDLLEREGPSVPVVDRRAVEVPLQPYEIKTLAIELP